MPNIAELRVMVSVAAAPLLAAVMFSLEMVGGPGDALLVALLALPLSGLGVWMLLGGVGQRPAPQDPRWSALSRAFHWMIALAILGTSGLMFWMQGMDFSVDEQVARAEYREWLALHKSIGLAVLFLLPARMAWNMWRRRPALLGLESRAQRMALAAVHATLYALMLAVPVAGWMASLAYGGKASFFGWFDLPQPVGNDEDLVALFYPAHKYGSWLLLGLVGLHVVAALWHHAIRRDATLIRMLPGRGGH